MEEYKEIMFLYEKNELKEKQVVWVTGSLLIGICAFLFVDVIKINPIILFAIGLLISIVFMWRNQLKSKNFDALEKYIKKYHSEYKNKVDFLFFLDVQLNKVYELNQEDLKKSLKSKGQQEKLSKQITDSYFLFESLQKMDRDNQLSLDY